ncbi:hypothetical protein MKZ38_000264 [Zalerion maritima]|uniref:Uncharacterized protein n=1 Tax=Zalerion maritima TaxID=339359 RepID=A0AAD5WTV1_9PEZI|nr:hypothetical protein MKZ38_000264 [Zalerion maritima]
MKLSATFVSVLAVANTAVASSWFSKSVTTPAYNKWHETELERWLADNDVPYPTPADRKELENIVGKNWNKYAVKPYEEWDPEQLNAYLTLKGMEVKENAETSKDSLIAQVKDSWYESEDHAQEAWTSVKDWILDTWTESQLKEFADKNGIPVPQPRQRDTLLQQARQNYEAIAKRAGDSASYPGNWLYESWSDSDLKSWLDTYGFPTPQPTNRDKLISQVRRNSRLAYLKMQDKSTSATASARAAYKTATDAALNSWSESQLKEFADNNGISVPQGTKPNELRSLIRKNRAEVMGNTVGDQAASTYGAASSKAGNEYAKASDSASLAAQDAFNNVVDTWSVSRLKAYLDARGIPVPQSSKTDELRALVRKNHHKAASGWTAWTFDDFSTENLKNYLANTGDESAKAVSEKADATREDLVSAAQSAYSSASSAGGDTYASVTSYLIQQTDAAKAHAFDVWTDTELKAHLDSYGVPVPQGSTTEDLRAMARKHSTYFKYGTNSPSETFFAKLSEGVQETWDWMKEKVGVAGDAAQKEAADAKAKVDARAEEVRDEL